MEEKWCEGLSSDEWEEKYDSTEKMRFLHGRCDQWLNSNFQEGDKCIAITEYRNELREYLLEQGIWEREVDELLSNFNQVSEDDLNIAAIFDSATDLGENYINNVVGKLDHHIDAVLDYSALGEQIAESDNEYVSLSSGRIVEFELQHIIYPMHRELKIEVPVHWEPLCLPGHIPGEREENMYILNGELVAVNHETANRIKTFLFQSEVVPAKQRVYLHLEGNNLTVNLDDIQGYGNCDERLKNFIKMCCEAGITTSGRIDYSGDFEGTYVITENVLEDLTQEQMALRNVSNDELIAELTRRLSR